MLFRVRWETEEGLKSSVTPALTVGRNTDGALPLSVRVTVR